MQNKLNVLDRSSLHLPFTVVLPSRVCSPVFTSSSLAILFIGILIVITLAKGKPFGLADTGQRVLEGNTAVGREGKALNTIIPTTHRTSFCGLSVAFLGKVGVMLMLFLWQISLIC